MGEDIAALIAIGDTPTTRVCGACGETKPLEAFYKDGKNSKGIIKYRRDCKDCYKATRVNAAAMKRRKAH